MKSSLPHPADVVRNLKRDLGEEIDRYHIFAQLQRFFLAWFGSFFLLSARGPVDGWNALYSTLLASAAVAARKVWPVVSVPLVLNFVEQVWRDLGGNTLAWSRFLGQHPAGNLTTGATQPTTMSSMNDPSKTQADMREVVSPTLRVPIVPPPTATATQAATQTFTLPPQAAGS
jgi:hypothetical protein